MIISTKDLDDIKEWISGSLKGIEMNDGWTARHQGRGVTRDVDVSDSVKTDLCADAIVRCRPVDTLQLQERSQTRKAVNVGGVVGVGCWSTRATGTVVLESKIFLRIFEELRLTLLEDL